MKQKLAILGASYLQEPLVTKAKELGIETHCFAWADGATCKDLADFFYPISILDKEEIFKKCKEIQIDGITTIATDMAVPTIGYVANILGLVSNSVESCLLTTNKGAMRTKLAQKKCAIPYFKKIVSFNESLYQLSLPLIVKPADRSGSRGVTKIDTYSTLQQAIIYALEESFSKEVMVEQFIEGKEVSVETISFKGQHHILTITDKITTEAPHFVELAHHQPSELTKTIQDKIKKETIKCLNALEVTYGASHAEFKITDEGEVYLIELGSRMGGDFIGSHLVKLSTGYDFVKGVIDVALGKFEIPNLNNNNNAGVYFLCKETEQILPYFLEDNLFDIEKKIQTNNITSVVNSNDRSGYLIYQSSQKVELL